MDNRRLKNVAVVAAILGVVSGLYPALWVQPLLLLYLLGIEFPVVTLVLLIAACSSPIFFPRLRRAAGGLLRVVGQGLWVVFVAIILHAPSGGPVSQWLLTIGAVAAIVFVFWYVGATLERKGERKGNVRSVPSLSIRSFAVANAVFVPMILITSILFEHIQYVVSPEAMRGKNPERDRKMEIARVGKSELVTDPLELPIGFTAPIKLRDGKILLAGNWGVFGDDPRKTTIIDSTTFADIPLPRGWEFRYARGTKPQSLWRKTWASQKLVEVPPIGFDPRGYSMADGSAVVIGGLRPGKHADSFVIPVQRWEARTGKWSIVPGLQFNVGKFVPETRTVPEDIVQQSNGDFIWSEPSPEHGLLGRTQMKSWEVATSSVHTIGMLQKWRSRFSAIQLFDGRLAIIGGVTLSEYVALEKDCDSCPDEYVSFGEEKKAGSTEVFDFAQRKAMSGPESRFPGGTAVRLSDGRVVKAGLNEYDEIVALEFTDRMFSRWELASPPPPDIRFTLKKLVALDQRVLMLPDALGPKDPGLVWDSATNSWSIWYPEHTLYTDQVLVLDKTRVFMLGGGNYYRLTYRTVEVP